MDLGDTLPFRSDLYDKPAEQGGILTNASAVTLTITLPDGTTVSPAITNPPAVTGKYFYDHATALASLPGRYTGQWLFTFSGGTAGFVQTFDVGSTLVTVGEAQSQLRSVGIITSASDLEQLQWLCLVATEAVERDLGRAFSRRTVVEIHNGGGGALILRVTPAVAITSVVESGVTSSVTDYVLDATTGLLHKSWGRFSGRQNVTVTYTAGYTDPPRVVRMVALLMVQQMWQSSQQASHPLLDESDMSGGGVTQWLSEALGGMPAPLRSAYESLRSPGIA